MPSTISNNPAAAQAVTITLASLADDAARQGTAVVPGGSLDELIAGEITLAASGISAFGVLELFVAASLDGTNFAGGGSAADADFTGDLRHLAPLATLPADANSQTVTFAGLSVAEALGGTVPPRWSLVVLNDTGQPLAGGTIRRVPVTRRVVEDA